MPAVMKGRAGVRRRVSAPSKFLSKSASVTARRGDAIVADAVGLFYGTTTGHTEEAADLIKSAWTKGEITDPTDISEVDISSLPDYDALIVGGTKTRSLSVCVTYDDRSYTSLAAVTMRASSWTCDQARVRGVSKKRERERECVCVVVVVVVEG